MKAEIESIVCNWADEIPHILVRVINAITLSANEEELRAAVKQIAEEMELDKFFAYGYGTHHFWLTHRRLSNGEPKEYRLLKAEFENMKKRVYRIRTQYIFEGVFEVVAESREDARQKVIQNCGLVMGGNIHSTLPDEKVNWAFSTHPEIRTGRITVQEEQTE